MKKKKKKISMVLSKKWAFSQQARCILLSFRINFFYNKRIGVFW